MGGSFRDRCVASSICCLPLYSYLFVIDIVQYRFAISHDNYCHARSKTVTPNMKLLSTSIAAKAVLCILLSDPTDAQTRLRALSESMSMMTEYDVNYINSNPEGGYTSSSKAAKMAESWTGELPWTLWAPGGCDARDPMAVGATGTLISLTKIAPEALCEEDRIDTPNGTMRVFTKLTKVDCGSESAEFLLWDCEDKSCSKCDPAPELGEL